jgi:hypothetical protein
MACLERSRSHELSVAPMSAEGGFTPIEFALLQQVEREDFGVLEPMVRALRQLSALMPNTCFQMGLCMLKQGRVFSLAESMPRRTGLIATEPALHFQDCISSRQDSINCK